MAPSFCAWFIVFEAETHQIPSRFESVSVVLERPAGAIADRETPEAFLRN
jgi:hypothetical protein